ncbi:MAG: DUF4922 domain-containing protein [candidate division KSB1 bacterium]|nr:DUF4922 domain-containing protein [candidate division KSB1 bacterium]MDZ7276385.1 DUF4922 domain-containing protein [candidate division KSB1 bacterium]MDZ7287663.1 DUF4922 domain-containing protein [candidate division KSB1 bacterium]MDZ7299997.1 DUF4922 domain-containing protein [candidate division KSB1 bacterium]MDZ7309201.1 DUF4922 domain-containing protein [candidate division KSB1 bacterium]
MQSHRFFAKYGAEQHSPALSRLALDLLDQQQATWPQLHEGYRGLANVQLRDLNHHEYAVRLQFNPRRVVSSGAKVDARSIEARPCFLCLENLPPQQQGILYHDDFLVLCNPAPIFPQHYTISHLQHQPQALAGRVETLLQLTRDFSPSFTVFYNGPKCGASAPDHLHFQACPRRVIPVETQMYEPARRLLVKSLQGVALHKLQGFGREVLLLTGFEAAALAAVWRRTLAAMQAVLPVDHEPMLNAICFYEDELYHVLLFPRRKHRPQVFYREGEDRILISPAAVDMGGLIITPIEKDFRQVEAELVAEIYREVSISPEVMHQILARI